MCSNNGESKCGCGQYVYVDRYMITAQIISIVAFVLSVFWWVTFFIGGTCFVLLQVIWCRRQSKVVLDITAGISFVAGITSVIAGIILLTRCKDEVVCVLFTLRGPDSSYYGYYVDDSYRDVTWALVAFVTAILWFATTGFILHFVKSGRHAKLEEKLQAIDTDTTTTTPATTTTTAIEMGAMKD